MSYFKGTDIYLIKEQIYSKSGLPSIGNTIGPTGIQVVKSVYQLMREQEAFYEGKPLNYGELDLWDKFKIVFGIDISERDKAGGKVAFSLAYCGFSTFITPVDGFDRILPKWFSTKHNTSIATPYTYGRDPIQHVNLYRNTRVRFFADNGGDGNPCALAKYNAKTQEMIYIDNEREFINIIKSAKTIKG